MNVCVCMIEKKNTTKEKTKCQEELLLFFMWWCAGGNSFQNLEAFDAVGLLFVCSV